MADLLANPETVAIMEALAKGQFNAPTPAYGTNTGVLSLLNQFGALATLHNTDRLRRGLQSAETSAVTGQPETPMSRLGGPVPPFRTTVAPTTPPAPGTGETPWGQPHAPRSVRLNNPGAIEFGRFAQQHGATGSDGRFARFNTPEEGWRAMEALLTSYMRRGLTTTRQIVGRWAPASDGNNVSSYAQHVSRALGVSPDAPLTAAHLPRLMEAMARHESGIPVTRTAAPVAPTAGAVQPTARRVLTLPVGPGAPMRLGGPRAESDFDPVTGQSRSLTAATRAGNELAPTNTPDPMTMLGATEVGGEGLHYTPMQGELQRNITTPQGTPDLLSPGARAPVTPVSSPGGPPGRAGETPPEQEVSVLAPSIAANTAEIRQIDRLLQIPKSDARLDELRKKRNELTAPREIPVAGAGTARYVYDSRQGRHILDPQGFQSNIEHQTLTIGGITYRTSYYLDARGRVMRRLERVGPQGQSGAPQGGAPRIDTTELNAAIASNDVGRMMSAQAEIARQIEALKGQSTARSADITEYERAGRTARERLDDIISLHTAVENTRDWRGYGSQFFRDLRTTMQNWGLDPGQLIPGTETTLSDFALRVEGALPRDGSGPQFSRLLTENPHLNNTKEGALLFLSYLRQRLEVAGRIGRAVTRLGANTHRLDETIRDIRSQNPITLRYSGSINVVAGNGTRRVNNPTIYITPIETQADFDRLQSGAVFIGAGGRYFQKP